MNPLWIVIILLVIIVLYTGWNSIQKQLKLEQEILDAEDLLTQEYNFRVKLLEDIRALDKREMFEKDDEVGIIFSLIKERIEMYAKEDPVQEE